MKNVFFIFLILNLNYSFGQANQEIQIKNTINIVFEAMKLSDSTLLKTVLDPECTLQTVGIKAGQPSVYKKDKIQNFITSIGTVRPNTSLEERLLSYQINIDEALAVAWTPYEFYINGKLSHFGTNVFTLIKTDTSWKIVSIIDTRKK